MMHQAALLTAAWLLCAISSVGVVAAANESDSQACCAALTAALGSNKVVYPTDEPYRSSIASYWAVQIRTVSPTCFVLPSSSRDVAKAVTALKRGRPCRFAVRSGGHKPWADAANIEDGVTIDLSALDKVRLSDDRTVASIGPGARWRDVYRELDRLGAAVVGGRNGLVGVGGLTLGGGISFFSGRYGFACDNVKSFEIVLASGEIVNANANERQDLFQALKGGSNNFGIVTRFDLMAFDQGPLWGGPVIYPVEARPQLIPAFVGFTDSIDQDPDASLILFQIYSANKTVIAMFCIYAKPEPFPAPFRDLLAIKPENVSTLDFRALTVANLSTQTTADASAESKRRLEATLTYANRPEVIQRSFEISAEMLEPVKTRRNLTWSTALMPIPRAFSDRSVERGGNVLGLDRSQENYVLFLLTIDWSDAADDKDISAVVEAAIEKLALYTREVRADNEWIYLNYALPSQDVISSYGQENVKKMRAASQNYDPDEVFQKRVVGGYKIPMAEEYEDD